MRILHCLRAPVGGLFRHVLDLAEEQARRGHDVGILADSNSEDRLTASKFAAVAPLLTLGIIRVPMSRRPGLGDLAAARTVRRTARNLRVDVLHGHGAKGGVYARLGAILLKVDGHRVRSFYTPHGGSLNFQTGTTEARIYMAVERALEKVTSGLIFESGYAATVYRRLVSASGAPSRSIPNGLLSRDFEQVEPSASATDVLFVGELRDIKGVDLLLRALSTLNTSRPVTATIVGGGPDADRLKALSSSLGLDERVSFTGPLPARSAFKLGRIIVVPSLAESFPYIVLESSAAGLPLISTNVGGIPEIVAGTDTELIQPGDAEALAKSIAAMLDDPETARGKADRLRDNVARKFTVENMASAVLDFYADAAPVRSSVSLLPA